MIIEKYRPIRDGMLKVASVVILMTDKNHCAMGQKSYFKVWAWSMSMLDVHSI